MAGNPYDQAGNPGMYEGSGYGASPGGPYAQGAGGSQSHHSGAGQQGAYPQGPYDTQGGQDWGGGGGGMVAPAGQEDYKNYTENKAGFETGSNGGEGRIDSETGIAPRRLTDCVCIPIFFIYVLAMMIIVGVADSRGDRSRLTRGFDYQARLCGYDVGVEDKPYLFWCRSFEESTSAENPPKALNIKDATCVKECPTAKKPSSFSQVSCLRDTISRGFEEQGGPAGVERSYLIHAEQSKALTWPYDTELFAGRYCMPVSIPLRAELLSPKGPVNLAHRAVNGFGSFQHYPVWLVLLFACFIAVILSFIYIFLIRYAGKYLIYTTLAICALLLFIAGGFFLWGFGSIPFENCQAAIPGTNSTLGGHPEYKICKVQAFMDTGVDSNYQKLNPIFQRNEPITACILSTSLGLLLVIAGIITLVHFANTESHWNSIADLIILSYDCVFSMKDMLVPPIIEAFWKYILTLILVKGFMAMLTVGEIDTRRIVVNGVHYEGASKKFYFDWYFLPYIIFYLYGCMWIMELCNAFGQFIVSYSVVSWYYIKGQVGPDGKKRKVQISGHNPAFMAMFHSVRYHLGSLFLGSSIIPLVRIPRMIRELVCVQLMRDSECPGPLYICNCCCKCLQSFVCTPCQALHCFDDNEHKEGIFAKYNKNAYIDIIIRANHFWPSAERAFNIFGIHSAAKINMGCIRTVTLIGVSAIGMICATITYNMLGIDTLVDPASLYFVQDPLFVSFLAMLLCGNIAYSFTMLIEHTNDTILYCYCHNRKFKKENIDDYIPEELRVIVGSDDKTNDFYPYYGKAEPNMYLGTWFNIKKEKPKDQPARNPGNLNATDYGQTGFGQTGAGGGQGQSQWAQQDQYGAQQGGYDTYGGGGGGTGYGGGGGGYGGPEQQPLTSGMR